MEYEINLKDIKEKIVQNENGWNNFRNVSIEEMDWLVEQAEKVEVLESRLENAIFNDHFEPVPKRTFPIEMKVSFGGKLPVPSERN